MTAGNQNDHHSEQILQLFHAYGNLMYQIAFSILKQEQNAEDAVQETLLKMIEKAEKLPLYDPDAMRRLIFVMTRNTALDLHRKLQVHISTDMNDESNQTNLILSESDLKTYQVHELSEIVRKLPVSDQKLIWMRYWENLTYRQIGKQLGITEQAVNSRIRRLLAHLKELFEGESDE